MKVFTDFHHSSLLRSLVILFEERFGFQVYRPIGMDWWSEGYWAINDQEDTAKQYLDLAQSYIPKDGTPPLNIGKQSADGSHICMDAGSQSFHRACTLEFFKSQRFDFVVASIPQHVELFKDLIEKYQPQARLIIQMGNNWNIQQYQGENVMASIKPVKTPGVNSIFYHQEFDQKIFCEKPWEPTRNVFSFVNCIKETGAWPDYQQFKSILERNQFNVRSFGGQCPDGNMTGPKKLAEAIAASMLVFHVKPGGDGFGHIIHNSYAMGRPVITRKSHYKGQLAEDLLVDDLYIDLDKMGVVDAADFAMKWAHTYAPEDIADIGRRAAQRFREVVDYDQEAKQIWQWLQKI